MGLYGLNEGSNYGFKWVGQLWQSRLLIFWGEYTPKSASLQGSNLSVHMIREVKGQSATTGFGVGETMESRISNYIPLKTESTPELVQVVKIN